MVIMRDEQEIRVIQDCEDRVESAKEGENSIILEQVFT
ncbi:hypothetical protein ABOONEI_816 [Aciduliprofundum boonei T469]|nr:hypothetical protein ABOONEI_816 [Aciduliprofundum boonei T469]